MRYLITTNTNIPFLTEWFDCENHFNNEIGMVVYDLETQHYTTNGKDWMEIENDHL